MDRDFFGSTDLERRTGTKASTWRYWASIGAGPASFKLGPSPCLAKVNRARVAGRAGGCYRLVGFRYRGRGQVMSDPRFKRVQVVRDAVEILTQLAASSREAEESVLSAAFTALCINAGLSSSSNPRVALRLHQWGLLEKASIDNLEYGKCRIDFAWPVKRVGLRMNSWPRRSSPRQSSLSSSTPTPSFGNAAG